MSDLHNAIMNIPCRIPQDLGIADIPISNSAYRIGHRDARHAAAELASEKISEMETAIRTIRNLVSTFAGCITIHSGYPDGFTCIDKQEDAKDPRSNYGDDWRAKLIAGKGLCERCRATLALREADSMLSK